MRSQMIIIAFMLGGYHQASASLIPTQLAHSTISDGVSSHTVTESSNVVFPITQEILEERTKDAQQMAQHAQNYVENLSNKDTFITEYGVCDRDSIKDNEVTKAPEMNIAQTTEDSQSGKAVKYYTARMALLATCAPFLNFYRAAYQRVHTMSWR